MTYDPNIGRWISEDPIGFQAADANLYRYVGNNPTNATDPSGLMADLGPLPGFGLLLPTDVLGWFFFGPRPPRPGHNSADGLFYPKPVNPDNVKDWLATGKLITVNAKADFIKKIASAKPGTSFKWVITKKGGQLRGLNFTEEPKASHPALSDPPMGPVWAAGRIQIGKDGKIYFNVESHHYETTNNETARKRAEEFFSGLDLDTQPEYTSESIK